MKHFLKYRIAEWILISGVAVSLILAVSAGFVLKDAYMNPLLVIVTALVLEFIMMIFSFSRVTTWIGIGVGIAVLAISIIIMNANNISDNETENSMIIYIFVAVLCSLVSFLLSRSRAGTIVLFAVGLIIVAGVEFLQWPEQAWSFILFPVCCSMLFLYRVYMISLKKIVLGTIKIRKYLLQVVVTGILALVLGFGIFYGVVQPLDPSTQEFKLLEMLKTMDPLKTLGITTTIEVLDPSLKSSQDPDSDETGEGEEESTEDDSGNSDSFDNDISQGIQNFFDVIAGSYEMSEFHWLWLLLIIPVAIIAAYILRIALKKKRRRRIQSLGLDLIIINYYNFFTNRLKKAGVVRPYYHTLDEYTIAQEFKLSAFDADGVTFDDLTKIYEKVTYGHQSASEEEKNKFEKFYDSFFLNLRKEIGTVKYYLSVFKY